MVDLLLLVGLGLTIAGFGYVTYAGRSLGLLRRDLMAFLLPCLPLMICYCLAWLASPEDSTWIGLSCTFLGTGLVAMTMRITFGPQNWVLFGLQAFLLLMLALSLSLSIKAAMEDPLSRRETASMLDLVVRHVKAPEASAGLIKHWFALIVGVVGGVVLGGRVSHRLNTATRP